MLPELSLSPSIFCSSAFALPEVCAAHLQALKNTFLEDALIHDLRSGDFCAAALGDANIHPKGKELMKKMIKKRRLFSVRSALAATPVFPADWVQEALESHKATPVSGIVACGTAKQAFKSDNMIADVANCTSATWWGASVARQSWNTARTVAGYSHLLEPLLRHANSLVIIDPHFDPSVERYQVLDQLLLPLRARTERPTVELHRVCYEGSGRNRNTLSNIAIEQRFSVLSDCLRAIGVVVEVFVWDDDHNRYLLTDLGDFLLGNGLDVSSSVGAQDTWSRIDRITADDIKRRHDPGVMAGKLRHRFVIGAQ
ncbi:hypothetical protein [Prosthecobacter dejongeii]|uniref:Uncharacterized protein n=1 Tax=Prosthecobacter dejongeii TaxID=48465 RepID=A0A7W7YPH7_9BACT|nr:hypothetical protein [Prosthecobacter dejongeii]MBB5039839.1 hypothetical protein [Prosthecobacter dejongeii]